MRYWQPNRRSMTVESLESRRLLAGVVTANVYGSTLLMVGDDNANDLVIEEINGALALSSGPQTTTIDSPSNLASRLVNVRHIEFRMNGGADRLAVRNVDTGGNLVASGTGDAMTIEVQSSTFARLNLRDRDAQMDVHLRDTQLTAGTYIVAGPGQFTLDAENVAIQRYFTVLRTVQPDASAPIPVGSANVVFRDSTLRTMRFVDPYSQHDLQFENSTTSSAWILETGPRELDIDIIDSQIGSTLRITDPEGPASIQIVDSTIGRSTSILHRGIGTTEMMIRNSALQSVNVQNRQGDSSIAITGNSRFEGSVTLETFAGNSEFDLGGTSIIVGALRHRTFGGDSRTYITDSATVKYAVDAYNRDGASDVQIVDNTTIGSFRSLGSTVHYSVEYAIRDGERLMADIYVPRNAGPHPALVTIHGGYWRLGSKSAMASRARKLADRGYVVMNINYRLAPADKFPAQIHDVHSAIMWLKDNAATYDILEDRVGVYGYSAGGHLALLAGLTATSDGLIGPDAGLADPTVRAVVAGAPATDFRDLPLDATRFEYFLGGTRAEVPENYSDASPAAFMDGSDPPTLVFAGQRDTVIDLAKAERLINDLGGDSEFYSVPGKTHTSAASETTALMRSMRFLDSHIKQ